MPYINKSSSKPSAKTQTGANRNRAFGASYAEAKSQMEQTGDNNYCSAIALSIVTGRTAGDCAYFLGKAGRIRGRGAFVYQIMGALNTLGHVAERVDIKGAVNGVERQLDKSKNYLIVIKDHILAAKNGIVEDYTKNDFRVIQSVWEIKKR